MRMTSRGELPLEVYLDASNDETKKQETLSDFLYGAVDGT